MTGEGAAQESDSKGQQRLAGGISRSHSEPPPKIKHSPDTPTAHITRSPVPRMSLAAELEPALSSASDKRFEWPEAALYVPLCRSPAVSVGQFRPGSCGGWLPRASSARAMRGWGPWNPKAIRVSRRILVLVDSISPWERPCSRWASMAARCLAILLARWTKAGSCDRRPQRPQRLRALASGRTDTMIALVCRRNECLQRQSPSTHTHVAILCCSAPFSAHHGSKPLGSQKT